MPSFRDDAVVLRRLDYSETSQVVVFFTRSHGKVRAIAKGIKRGTKTRFAAGIDLLDVGSLVISGRHERPAGLAIIAEWKQTRCLAGLRDKLARLHAAQYLAEITAELTEDWDPHTSLFSTLVQALGAVAGVDDPTWLIVSFQFALLEEIGSLPRFDACVGCGGKSDLTHFSPLEGGSICRNCEASRIEKREVRPTLLPLLQEATVPASGLGGEFDEADKPGSSLGRQASRGTESPSMRAIRGHEVSKATEESSFTDRRTPLRCRRGSVLLDASRSDELIEALYLLNYHIAHLMGKEPRLFSRLVPSRRTRSRD